MKVLKFGGSSVATADAIRAVVTVVTEARTTGPTVVVVSALGGVTDDLTRAAQRAAGGDRTYLETLAGLERRHRAMTEELVPAAERAAAEARHGERLDELWDLLRGVFLVREASPRTFDSVLSYGERLSAPLVAAALRSQGVPAEAVDARELLVTDDRFGGARVDFEASFAKVRRRLKEPTEVPVVTGFVAATAAGETTTLGRGGSDYTAALLGAALDAEAVELWTDVDGVMSADPRLVDGARPIPRLAYEELMELSHFGAKVVYPPSVHPTRKRSIPLLIRNTFNPAAPGTRVVRATELPQEAASPVRGIASIHRIALLRLEGDGMVGVPGIAGRLFTALARSGVNVVLITQASSEHSICFAVAPEAVTVATRALGEEFALERAAGLIDELVVEQDLAVVAAVGRGMRERTGLAARLFDVLGRNGVNLRAIAQGSSELNVSLVVGGGDEARAVRALHEAFFSPPRRRVEVVLAGSGRVGGAFLDQLTERREALQEERGLELALVGIAGRRGLLFDADGLDPATAAEALRQAEAQPLTELEGRWAQSTDAVRVLVDCTASDAVATLYDGMLAAGVRVVTANKRRLAGPLEEARQLLRHPALYCETTVGAGLPVVRPLEELLVTGDRLRSIDGLLSGTLTFLFDRLADGVPFSAAVREAHELGYTEPDPREDLGGRDVARKLIILARLAGRPLSFETLSLEPLLPAKPWNELSLEELWRRLPEVDETFAARRLRAAEAGRRLAYLGHLGDDGARVGLQEVAPEHPCAAARGTDNLIAIATERYSPGPLVIRGPGAGPAVTAAGVFADVLRAATEVAVEGRAEAGVP